MGRDGDGGPRRGAIVGGSNEDDVGEARPIGPREVLGIEGRPEPEKSDFGFQVFDLPLAIFLGLVGLFVALFARAGVTWLVRRLARQALHRRRDHRRRLTLAWDRDRGWG